MGRRQVAIQGDGKIIVVGFGGGGVALARYETDGSLDPSFGDGGKVNDLIVRMGVTAAAIQRDGQIVVGGFAVNRELDFALARFNNDGSLDTSFGSGGEVTTDFGGNGDVSQGIAIQMNGRIVAVGYTEGDTDTDFALARYKTDGTIEKSFGRAGRVTTDFNGTRDSAAAVAIQRNGRIGAPDRPTVAQAATLRSPATRPTAALIGASAVAARSAPTSAATTRPRR